MSMPAIIFLFYHGFDVSSLSTLYPELIARSYILFSIFMGFIAGFLGNFIVSERAVLFQHFYNVKVECIDLVRFQPFAMTSVYIISRSLRETCGNP